MGEALVRDRRGDFRLTLKVRCGIIELFDGEL